MSLSATAAMIDRSLKPTPLEAAEVAVTVAIRWQHAEPGGQAHAAEVHTQEGSRRRSSGGQASPGQGAGSVRPVGDDRERRRWPAIHLRVAIGEGVQGSVSEVPWPHPNARPLQVH